MSLDDIIDSITVKVEDFLEPHVSRGQKNALIATILGLFFPGTGHMYIWETKKGVNLFLLWIVLWILAIVLQYVISIGFLFTIAIFILAIYAAYDAYKLTNEYNVRNGFV